MAIKIIKYNMSFVFLVVVFLLLFEYSCHIQLHTELIYRHQFMQQRGQQCAGWTTDTHHIYSMHACYMWYVPVDQSLVVCCES